MTPFQNHIDRTRRDFLTSSACGLGGAALSAMLSRDGVLAANTEIGRAHV